MQIKQQTENLNPKNNNHNNAHVARDNNNILQDKDTENSPKNENINIETLKTLMMQPKVKNENVLSEPVVLKNSNGNSINIKFTSLKQQQQ